MNRSFSFGSVISAYAPPSRTLAEQAMDLAIQGDAAAARGDHQAARERYSQSIHLQPDSAIFHWALGTSEERLGNVEEAGNHYQKSVLLDPRFAIGHSTLGEWYLNRGIPAAALTATTRAVELAPENPHVLMSHAWVLEAMGNLDESWNCVQKLAASPFRAPDLAKLYGRLARWRGKQEDALNFLSPFLRDGNLSGNATADLHLTAADLLDSLGRYDDAFASAAQGNALRRPPYDPAAVQEYVDRVIAYFTPQRLRSLPKATYRSDKPVFIVGMPRSGSTLVEQILASHPAVHGAGELDCLSRVAMGTLTMLKAGLEEYPACLNGFSLDQADGMAQIYLEPVLSLNREAARITDKMPLNFLHLGLVSVLFPDARIIHCRRDAMDTCVSCFMTSFNTGNDFKYDLTHLGHFYRQYERLMDHWKKVVDVPILEVNYEDVVANVETESRRMIDFLGLPWDEQCLSFHASTLPAVTSSVQQVRRPIYAGSVQRWRRYEKHLGPLKAALENR
jgi:tetratricopeptide (TPR) repeat protein